MPTLETVPSEIRELIAAEEFLDFLEPGTFADLISGKIYMHSPVSFRHATVVNTLDALLRYYVSRKRLGRVDRESIAVRFSARDVFMPDLMFISNDQISKLNPAYVQFAPRFIVEAMSPSTMENDRHRKFAAYELHGVQEYWLLDPLELDHRFFTHDGELFREYAQTGDTIRSNIIPGFWIRREWLNPDRPPELSAALDEIFKGEPA